MRSAPFFLIVAAVALSLALEASDWTRFRGPNGSGIAETSGLPVDFGPQSGIVWKIDAPPGRSSPILTKSRIFLTAVEGEKLVTLALDRANGKVVWRREIDRPRAEQHHKLNSPASSTPTSDGQNVYSFFGDIGLVSYGPDGNERWRVPLGPFTNLHGMAASPILLEEKLILVCDHDNDSFVMAVHKDTGKPLWKTARPDVVHGFATPAVYRPANGPAQVIVPGSYRLDAYSAGTGERLWWVHGLTWQVKPTAIVASGTIYATGWAPGADAGQRSTLPAFNEAIRAADQNGDGKFSPEELPKEWKHGGSWNFIDLDRDGFLDERDWIFYRSRRSAQNITMAIRPENARGDLTKTHVLWTYDRSVPVVSSPLLYEGLLYTVKDGGILTALDPETGALRKQGRLRDAIDSYYASPVAGDGKIYLASETGKISVLKPGAEWETLAVNDMEENCYASPTIADSRIYLRTGTKLYCFGKK
ncbi:MAG: PQQ-binding-like beta-propeller repeat protein [Bryobacteraceae bacterium]